jgi:hypothetical protein
VKRLGRGGFRGDVGPSFTPPSEPSIEPEWTVATTERRIDIGHPCEECNFSDPLQPVSARRHPPPGLATVAGRHAADFPFDVGRYAVGSAVLAAVLPPHDGPTVTVPVTMTDEGLAERDGVEAKAIVVEQLARAVEVIGQHNPARIASLGGECSVSVAPFSALAARYEDDFAIVWDRLPP